MSKIKWIEWSSSNLNYREDAPEWIDRTKHLVLVKGGDGSVDNDNVGVVNWGSAPLPSKRVIAYAVFEGTKQVFPPEPKKPRAPGVVPYKNTFLKLVDNGDGIVDIIACDEYGNRALQGNLGFFNTEGKLQTVPGVGPYYGFDLTDSDSIVVEE